MINKPIKTVFEYVGHSFRTVFGRYQMPYSKEWDTVLNQLLDAVEQGKCSAEIHGHVLRISGEAESYDICVANRWYAYGNLYMIWPAPGSGKVVQDNHMFRPKFSTMLRLNDVAKNLKSVDNEVKINKIYGNIRENLK